MGSEMCIRDSDPVNAVNEEPVEEAGNGHSDVPTPPRLHSPNILRDIDFNGADPVSIADRATYSLSPLATQIANAATQSTASHLASRFSAMDDKLMNLVNRPHLFEGDPKAAMGEVRSHKHHNLKHYICLLYTSPSPRDATLSRMPSSA